MIDLIEITKEQALELEDEQVLVYNPNTNNYYTEKTGIRFQANYEHETTTFQFYRFTNKVKSEEMYFKILDFINYLEEQKSKDCVVSMVNVDFVIETLRGIIK